MEEGSEWGIKDTFNEKNWRIPAAPNTNINDLINLDEQEKEEEEDEDSLPDIIEFSTDHQGSIPNVDVEGEYMLRSCDWISDATRRTKDPVVRLHNEIIDLYNYLSPTQKDRQDRDKAIEKYSIVYIYIYIYSVRDVVSKVWPEAKVLVFGSYATGLFLPTSDIDLGVMTPPGTKVKNGTTSLIYSLKAALVRENTAEEHHIECITGAKVPILRMREKETGTPIDISFNMLNGYKAAEVMKEYLKHYPHMKYLVFIVKLLLRSRSLGDAFGGGLSPYLTQLLVIRYIQEIYKVRRVREIVNISLGDMLIDFFFLYGHKFNYEEVGICVLGTGEYFPHYGDGVLTIRNPQEPAQYLGGAVKKMGKIIKLFKHVHDYLKNVTINGSALGPIFPPVAISREFDMKK